MTYLYVRRFPCVFTIFPKHCIVNFSTQETTPYIELLSTSAQNFVNDTDDGDDDYIQQELFMRDKTKEYRAHIWWNIRYLDR